MAMLLVVDDEIVLREMLQDFLESLGYSVVTAETAEEAIEICRTHQGVIHVIMTDFTLPGMDGVQLISHVVTLRPHMHIIVMSAPPMFFDIDPEALPPNAIRVKKPFDLDVLEETLHDLLTSS